jgi:hypothetical protein
MTPPAFTTLALSTLDYPSLDFQLPLRTFDSMATIIGIQSIMTTNDMFEAARLGLVDRLKDLLTESKTSVNAVDQRLDFVRVWPSLCCGYVHVCAYVCTLCRSLGGRHSCRLPFLVMTIAFNIS